MRRRFSQPSLDVGRNRSDGAKPRKVLIRNLKFESFFDFEKQFDDRDGVESQVISEVVTLRDGRRVSLQVGGQRMHDFFGDRGVDPFSHHGYSLPSRMRPFAVASARRRLTINNRSLLTLQIS